MSTLWSKEGDIADLYSNVLLGDHADGTEIIIGSESGDYIICFSDT